MESTVIAAKKSPELIDYLMHRRSVPLKDIGGTGPDDVTLNQILKIASRVPDHGKLCPWYFIVFQGQARQQMGAVFRARYQVKNPMASANELQIEENRFLRAPVVVAVVARHREGKTPWWEQILSAGAVCHNLMLAAHGYGFAANWLTDWVAFDDEIKTSIGLDQGRDHIAGFIYLGTMMQMPVDRERPDLNEIVTDWHPGVTLKKGDVYDRAGYGFAASGFDHRTKST